MQLMERFWAAVTTLIGIVTLSPLPDGVNQQAPLHDSLLASLPPKTFPPGPNFPIFAPPGAPPGTIKCEYPAMSGWEDCSRELDRKCWLRRRSDGKQFDINTDYENIWPEGITRYYHIDLKDSWFAADGRNFSAAKLFRDLSDPDHDKEPRYPGPWIQACWGDRLIVNVTNSLIENGTSVHWHGIRQLDTVHMDGVNGVTQCPIAPGDHFVYDFRLKQYGSSWYHSHYSVQYADGAVGPLTIHGPTSADWDEAVSPPLIMTDWYHKSAFYVLTNRSDTGGKDILLNGRGNITRFDNSAKKDPNIDPLSPLSIQFDPPRPGQGCKKYLLRIINTSFDTTFVFSIDNHLLQVVSADFVPIQPYRNTSILVGIGQRYNVIVEANPLHSESPLDPNGNYWIRTEIATCFLGSVPGDKGYDQNGILRYNATSDVDPQTTKWRNIALGCSDETYTSLNPILPWVVDGPSNGVLNSGAPKYGQEFEVYFAGAREPMDYPIAGFTLDDTDKGTPLRVNYSDPIFLHLDPKKEEHWPETWRVVPENYTNNKWIYLVMHGRPAQGTGGAHPIHLHGHDFAILEQAQNKTWDPKSMNLKLRNPPRRDVVLLPTNGYVVIAFKADNPGPWLVHCHIAVHVSMGLGMQILEDQAGAFRLWPDDDEAIVEAKRVCKNWDKWYSSRGNWAFPPAPDGKCNWIDQKWCFQDDSGV